MTNSKQVRRKPLDQDSEAFLFFSFFIHAAQLWENTRFAFHLNREAGAKIKEDMARREETLKMWQMQVFGLLLLSLTGPCYGLSNCCSDPTDEWNNTAICKNNSRSLLVCPGGAFRVNPADDLNDTYELVDGDLHFTANPDYIIASSEFCLETNRTTRSESAFVCFEVESTSLNTSTTWRPIFFGILSLISSVFFIVTFLVYVLLPELRDVQGMSLMGTLGALVFAYTVLAIQQLGPGLFADGRACVTVAFIMYYSFMAAFFWMNIVSFDVWRTIWFKYFRVTNKTLFLIYCLIGWGGPTFFLAAAYASHRTEGGHLKPGFAISRCWFEGHTEKWVFFSGPITCLIALNLIYFILSSWRLWHQYRDLSGSRLRCLRFKFVLNLKLFLIMGITWIFEIAASTVGENKQIYWILTDVFNSLQGLIMFLLLVAMRKRVRKLLVKNRPFNINFPKSWAAGEDEECEGDSPEEIVLS